jgi:hypothetical protein
MPTKQERRHGLRSTATLRVLLMSSSLPTAPQNHLLFADFPLIKRRGLTIESSGKRYKIESVQ